MDYCKCCDTVIIRYCDFLCYHVWFRRYDTKYIIWLWQKVKWSPWQPRGVFAMAPFLKMFRAANCTSVPSFTLLWKSEHYFLMAPGLKYIFNESSSPVHSTKLSSLESRDARYWIFANIWYADSRYKYISFCLETTPGLSCRDYKQIIFNFG